MTLIFSKSRDQLLYRMPLSLGLSDVSARLDSGRAVLAGLLCKWCCVLLCADPLCGPRAARSLAFLKEVRDRDVYEKTPSFKM